MEQTNTVDLIEKAAQTHRLTAAELATLLALDDEPTLALLFHAARRVREQHFGDLVFLYGFVYFTTWCRNNCTFCYYRRDNETTIRYRKRADEVRRIAADLAASGVHVIDLTMGEDPLSHDDHFAAVLALTKDVIDDNGLPVMISPGVVKHQIIDRFAAIGATWYALYQETYNRQLFSELRLAQNFEERLAAKDYARQQGLLIEEGLLVGVGEQLSDLAEGILQFDKRGCAQGRAMGFVPQEGTPLANRPFQDSLLELKVIALLRLLYPHMLIPASLDVEGINGLLRRMEAGCNVVTSLIPPATGLAGVAQSKRDVEEGCRTVAEVAPRLAKIGLTAATNAEYQTWLRQRQAASS